MKGNIPDHGDNEEILGVSVIICCYNSTSRLPRTLDHLAKQDVPKDFNWEIILVNNASTDETVNCAKEVWRQYGALQNVLNIIDENTPGQMYARRTGAKAARYNYLIFCDDDNLLGKNYVANSIEFMTRDKSIGAVGGQNFPVTDAVGYPAWFEEYKDKYATGVPAKQSGDVTYRGFILGAGLVTRKELFLEVFDKQYPSLLNGRNGEKLSTGDDFEYCKRLILWGYKLFYDERLLLDHFIPKERLTIDYRERLMVGIHDAGKVLSEYDRCLQILNKNRNKSRIRLLIVTPLRIFLIKLKLSKRNLENERLTLFYLSPIKAYSNDIQSCIKNFLNGYRFN